MNYHFQSSVIQMNEPWSIPRASLGSIASSTSQKSNSNPASVKVHMKKNRSETNMAYQSGSGSDTTTVSGTEHEKKLRPPSKTLEELQNKFDEFSSRNKNINNRKIRNNNDDENNVNPKRGSRSSQGSTDSNHSSHSASSGSLLLTAANLERFTHIHKKNIDKNNIDHQQYNTNITLSSQHKKGIEQRTNDSCIQIDSNLIHAKTKDVDTISMASSTHFTVVNGMGGPQRSSKSGLCSRGHQITVLIVSMSMVFLIGIMGAIYYLEMRAREMPH